MTPDDPHQIAAVLLPHFAATLLRLRTQLGLTLIELADALNETEAGEMLARKQHVNYSTISKVERAQRWPRDPDAWARAYAEVADLEPYEIWSEAMSRWFERLEEPGAQVAARSLLRSARRLARAAGTH